MTLERKWKLFLRSLRWEKVKQIYRTTKRLITGKKNYRRHSQSHTTVSVSKCLIVYTSRHVCTCNTIEGLAQAIEYDKPPSMMKCVNTCTCIPQTSKIKKVLTSLGDFAGVWFWDAVTVMPCCRIRLCRRGADCARGGGRGGREKDLVRHHTLFVAV